MEGKFWANHSVIASVQDDITRLYVNDCGIGAHWRSYDSIHGTYAECIDADILDLP